ncbi:MAG: sulfatase [Candidatus Hermodarchaeota archaeon]
MSEKFNVLFIITDQHRADHMSCSGNRILKTPNLDRLASEGVRFTNAYCNSPMCMPNRATLLTGLYPNIHGVRSNGINLPETLPTINQTLIKRGWHTGAIGKMHLQFWGPPYKISVKSAEKFFDWVADDIKKCPVRENFPIPYYGFQEIETAIGHGEYLTGHYMNWLEERAPQFIEPMKKRFKKIFNFFLLYHKARLTEDTCSTAFVKERTINFLEKHSNGDFGEKPFFLHCSFPDPHHPVCPPGKYKDLYKSEDIQLPESFDNIQNLYNHPFLGPHLITPVFRGAMLRESTEDEVKKFLALTYGSIAMIDNSIGQILAALDKLGLDDNTIVIYTSDHGDFCGDHGMLLKGPAPFNGILQVPLIWKVPGLTKGSISDSLVSSIDIPKTILHLLGIKERFHPPNMQGCDLTLVLKDTTQKVRDHCLIMEDEEIGPNGPLYCRLRHLITEEYKLTIYEGVPDYGDLYHRKNDPNELNNLWFNRDYSDVRLKLLHQLYREDLKSQGRFPKRNAGV